jgi:peptide/nickel transport system ATP-binding protein
MTGPSGEIRGEPDALAVNELDVAYRVRGRQRRVLRKLSFCIGAGEAFGLVGESGCGKSTAALAAVRYLPRNGFILGGDIHIEGHDLLGMNAGRLRELRASTVAMVYQDPAGALNPSMRVGAQIGEIFTNRGETSADAREMAAAMLERVWIADHRLVLDRYPHELSGGMQQRVSIAMALSVNPRLLILDEPTTGLDATVEAEILDLIRSLRQEFATSLLFISHNLAVISRMCDRVGVLYAGSLVEEGPTPEVFGSPRHPYTVGLMRCLPGQGRRKDRGRLDTIPGFLPPLGAELPGCLFAPRCGLAEETCRTDPPPLYPVGTARQSRCHLHERAPSLPRATAGDTEKTATVDRSQPALLRASALSKTFGTQKHPVRALGGVSFDLWEGETLGLVGESGSGKTTLARLLLGLTPPDAGGDIELDGRKVAATTGARERAQLQSMQIVFQNPDSALNRSHTVRRLIGRVLARLARVPPSERPARLVELTRSVQLADRYLSARPRQLSGGLKQRVAIARAFAGEPRIVVCDEPTSALDVSVQAAILNLLASLQAERRVSYIFISHDLGTVRYLSDRIAVLYRGRLMEIGPAERVVTGPHHPYTEALMSAVPTLDGQVGERVRLGGETPGASDLPRGCVFQARCPHKLGAICETEEPPLHRGTEPGHDIRCHIPVAELPGARETP